MKRALISAAMSACFAFAAYADGPPEVDQIAQQKMIGLAKKKIFLCMGAPAKRMRIGATEVWTYPVGSARVGSPFPAPALDMALPNVAAAASSADGACNVVIVMTNARVSQVAYSSASGGELPLGRQCLFAVENCTTPFAVRAAY